MSVDISLKLTFVSEDKELFINKFTVLAKDFRSYAKRKIAGIAGYVKIFR